MIFGCTRSLRRDGSRLSVPVSIPAHEVRVVSHVGGKTSGKAASPAWFPVGWETREISDQSRSYPAAAQHVRALLLAGVRGFFERHPVPVGKAPNRTAKLARSESVRDAADNAERPRSLGPARAAARHQGPRTAANRTDSSNLARFFCYIKGLLAEGRELGSNLLSKKINDLSYCCR